MILLFWIVFFNYIVHQSFVEGILIDRNGICVIHRFRLNRRWHELWLKRVNAKANKEEIKIMKKKQCQVLELSASWSVWFIVAKVVCFVDISVVINCLIVVDKPEQLKQIQLFRELLNNCQEASHVWYVYIRFSICSFILIQHAFDIFCVFSRSSVLDAQSIFFTFTKNIFGGICSSDWY